MRLTRAAMAALFALAFGVLRLPGAQAQELEPRAFANTPVGLNFLLAGYSYIDGTVALNVTLPVEDAEVRSHSGTLAYIRAFDLAGMSSKVGVIIPFGALIVAKAILLVEKLPVPRLFSSRAVYSVLWKTIMFGAVATLFRALEELLPQIAKHGGWVRDAQEIVEAVSWQHFLVLQMWLLMLLFFTALQRH